MAKEDNDGKLPENVAKTLPTKALAEHFRHIKYTQLNSDVFMSIVDFDWNQMTEEYRQCKQVEGLVDASIYEVLLTLRHFKRIVGLNSSKKITQQSLDTFVLKRGEEVGKNTLNKDIRNLHAFLNWAVKNRFVASADYSNGKRWSSSQLCISLA